MVNPRHKIILLFGGRSTPAVLPRSDFVYVAEGESTSANSFIANAGPLNYVSWPISFGCDWPLAVGGSTLADAVTRQAAALAKKVPSKTNIVSVLLGLNEEGAGQFYDGPGGTGFAGYLVDLFAYCDTFRADGWKVLLATQIGGAQAAAWEAGANPGIRASVGTHCDAVLDFAANSIIGTNGDYTNRTYWLDDVHPGPLGNLIMRGILAEVMEGFGCPPSALFASPTVDFSDMSGLAFYRGAGGDTHINSSNVLIHDTAANTPRMDYRDGVFKGLMLESIGRNWAAATSFNYALNGGFTSAVIAGLDGGDTAARLTETNTNVFHNLAHGITNSGTETDHIFILASTARYIKLCRSDAIDFATYLPHVIFDWQTKTIVASGDSGTTGGTFLSAVAENIGGGIWRLSLSTNMPAAAAFKFFCTASGPSAVGLNAYQGSTSNIIDVWGWGLEHNNNATRRSWLGNYPDLDDPATGATWTSLPEMLGVPIPEEYDTLTLTFDDDSQQAVTPVSGLAVLTTDATVVGGTIIDRPRVKRIVAS